MSNRHWMPLHIGDYLADTHHFTAAEHGAYLLLLMFYWSNGGLPDDEKHIQRITKLRSDAWRRSRVLLKSKFSDRWKHKRVDAEIAQLIEKSKAQSANAKRKFSPTTRTTTSRSKNASDENGFDRQKRDERHSISAAFDRLFENIGGEEEARELARQVNLRLVSNGSSK